MAQQPNQAIAIATLVAGLASIVLAIIFFFTPAGAPVLYAALIVGIIAVILGILALRRGQSRGLTLIGLIAGAVSAVWAIATVLFALFFVGAISF